jgi:hypothetical protein
MANSSLTLSSLDFDTLKQNFKEYLSTQSVFRDYDFDASNINVLLDVMSYNSYLNSFYLNMVASEMFLDSAQKYDSVVSHAKELNYVPRSAKSAAAEISFSLETTGLNGQITLPKGTKFTGINANGSFAFTTDEVNTYTSSNNTFNVANLTIYEGSYFKDSFVVDYNIENQLYLLSNKNIDTNSLTVTVTENNGATITSFGRADTLFGLDSASEIFFLQGAHNSLYEVVFGDGLFGRKPLNGAVVTAEYRVCSGTDAIGSSSFELDNDLGPTNGGSVNVSNGIITVSASNSGANQESIESIRFASPRYFATQQRAIATDDYSSLILANFGGEISDVIVYGGETVEPKLYGRVIVSIKPASGQVAPNYLKTKINNYLRDYIALPNRILISDPDYLFCSVLTEVQYDKTITNKTASEIKTIVLNSVIDYSNDNLEKFGNDLRYSRLVTKIDSSDASITSNDTDLRIVKRISPLIDYSTSYDIDVGNPIYDGNINYSDVANHKSLHNTEFDLHSQHAAVISSRFTYNLSDTVSYDLCFIEDDGEGNLIIFNETNDSLVPIAEAGTVNYDTGICNIKNLNVDNYGAYISIYFRPRDKDILSQKNKIIVIDPTDVSILVIEKQS